MGRLCWCGTPLKKRQVRGCCVEHGNVGVHHTPAQIASLRRVTESNRQRFQRVVVQDLIERLRPFVAREQMAGAVAVVLKIRKEAYSRGWSARYAADRRSRRAAA